MWYILQNCSNPVNSFNETQIWSGGMYYVAILTYASISYNDCNADTCNVVRKVVECKRINQYDV
jgi:hypothetical protein